VLYPNVVEDQYKQHVITEYCYYVRSRRKSDSGGSPGSHGSRMEILTLNCSRTLSKHQDMSASMPWPVAVCLRRLSIKIIMGYPVAACRCESTSTVISTDIRECSLVLVTPSSCRAASSQGWRPSRVFQWAITALIHSCSAILYHINADINSQVPSIEI
jgi:hypothetical protein